MLGTGVSTMILAVRAAQRPGVTFDPRLFTTITLNLETA